MGRSQSGARMLLIWNLASTRIELRSLWPRGMRIRREYFSASSTLARALALTLEKSALKLHKEHSTGLSENLTSRNSWARRFMHSWRNAPSSPLDLASSKNQDAAWVTPFCWDSAE